MRKVIAFLLLAGTAAPALAAGSADDHRGGWQHRDSDSRSQNDNRSDRSERPRFRVERNNDNNGNNERPQPEARVRPQIDNHVEFRGNPNVNVDAMARPDRPDVQRVREVRGDNNESVRNWHGSRVVDRANVGDGNDGVRNWRGPNGGDSNDRVRTNWTGRVVENPNVSRESNYGTLRRGERSNPAVFRNRVPVVSDQPIEGSQPRIRVDNRRRDTVVNWSTRHWRNDNRYDWQNHRRHHRSLFHLGIYFDPFGWNYRPYQVGWRLWPSYYQQNYWLNDPWQYRLPYAPPGTRWIRYYDDALLVDTWNGEVVDVIYNFFW